MQRETQQTKTALLNEHEAAISAQPGSEPDSRSRQTPEAATGPGAQAREAAVGKRVSNGEGRAECRKQSLRAL